MKRIITKAIAVCGWLLLGLQSASATPVVLTNGTLSVNNGAIFATEQYTNNFSISYDVTQDGDQVTYAYTLNVPLKNLSHWILQLSPNFTSGDLVSSSGPPFDIVGPTTHGPGGSNPGIPGSIFSYKFTPTGSVRTGLMTYVLVTDRMPTNGSFYARDGGDVYAYNTGFSNPSSGAFLIVPDSVAVPEPSSLLLAVAGISLVMLCPRKHR